MKIFSHGEKPEPTKAHERRPESAAVYEARVGLYRSMARAANGGTLPPDWRPPQPAPIVLSQEQFNALHTGAPDSAEAQAFMASHKLAPGQEALVSVEGKTFAMATKPEDFGTEIISPEEQAALQEQANQDHTETSSQ